jgi:hypothetical protein
MVATAGAAGFTHWAKEETLTNKDVTNKVNLFILSKN